MNLTRTTNRSMEYRRNKTSSEFRISTKTTTKFKMSRKPRERQSNTKAWFTVLVLVLRLALAIATELVGSGKRLTSGTFTGIISYAN